MSHSNLVNSALVSIIIPTYNRKALLVEAIECCLKQSWTNIDIIIIDDGSSDGTEEWVIERLQANWPKDQVRYVLQENKGASAARNHGLGLAKGEYIQFLDSDDLLMPDKLVKQMDLLEKPENTTVACCYCYGLMGENFTALSSNALERIGYFETDPIKFIRQLSSRLVHGMQTSAPLWRRDFLLSQQGWREDIGLGDDLEYHIRLLPNANSLLFIDEALFFVRVHPDARLSTGSLTEASLVSIIKTRQSVFNTLQQIGQWDAEMQTVFLHAMRTIYANCLALDNPRLLNELETWLSTLVSAPQKNYFFIVLIKMRRCFGRSVLLFLHKTVQRLKG